MTVRIETNGGVWTVIHSRPEARNAMDPKSAAALLEAFKRFDADRDAAVAVLWGEGGAFCAGYDLKSIRGSEDLSGLQHGPMGPTRLALDKPVIAAVSGPAVAGGFELALWCDVRVMEASAYFGVYCRRWGVPLVDGGTVRLPRLVGTGRALELILTGRKLTAQEALRIGACEHVVPDGEVRAFAEAMAHEMARFPQQCLRADRRAVYAGQGLPLAEALRQEWQNGAPVLASEAVAGARRFSEGRGRHGDFSDI